MALYLIDTEHITPVTPTTFAQEDLREKTHLQGLLKSKPEVISPNTLIVAEEFSDWEDSRRRIDLLGVDKNANLVVIELKRTPDGGFMDLQAIRYAAIISTMTFDKLVQVYEQYLKKNGIGKDAKDSLFEFLDWDEFDGPVLGQETRIVLASAEFSKELTTSVLWLNERGLDIRCVRMSPYINGDQILLDVQTIVPIPEAEKYQIRIREKRREEQLAKVNTRDNSKYDLMIDSNQFTNLSKRHMMLRLVSEVLKSGKSSQQVEETLPLKRLMTYEGRLGAAKVKELLMREDAGGTLPRYKRFFCDDDQLIHLNGKTYVLSNQWGRDTIPAVQKLAEKFPDLEIDFSPTESDGM